VGNKEKADLTSNSEKNLDGGLTTMGKATIRTVSLANEKVVKKGGADGVRCRLRKVLLKKKEKTKKRK